MYVLGVDVGTAWVKASVEWCGSETGEQPTGISPAPLPRIENASATAFVEPSGRIVTGDEAERLGVECPENLIREYTGRVGDGVHIVAGDHAVQAETVMAAAVQHTVERVAAQLGCRPFQVCVTHPASWGSYKTELLTRALLQAGLDDVMVAPDAAAAAGQHVGTDLGRATTLAVYDLGGDSVDAAVVRCDDGAFGVLGNPQRTSHVGGASFDQALFEHLCRSVGLRTFNQSVAGLGAAVRTLRKQSIAAKETLSVDTDAMVSVQLPGLRTRVRVVRAEFEDAIRSAVQDSVDALREAIHLAGLQPADIDAVVLVGGSCRIPLVVQTVSAELRLPVAVGECPEATVARGAARMAAERARALRRRGVDATTTTGCLPDAHPAVIDEPDAEPEDRSTDAGEPAPGPSRHRATPQRKRHQQLWPARLSPSEGRAKKRAVATTLLATAIFAASSMTAPAILKSGGIADQGVLAGSDAPMVAPRPLAAGEPIVPDDAAPPSVLAAAGPVSVGQVRR